MTQQIQPIHRGALYYPYIEIPGINWLRANLLVFPVVKRIMPMYWMPADDEAIRPFTEWFGAKQPLLQPADLWTDRPQDAQRVLAEKLSRDSEDDAFLNQFGRAAARNSVGEDDLGFQIHLEKLSEPLKKALVNEKLPEEKQLAWEPVRQLYDVEDGFVEVHPRVGEAIMSTLAIAATHPEGLAIVGDRRSGALHQCLRDKNLDEVYDAWLSDGPINLPPPNAPTGERLLEFIVGMSGDLSTLSRDTFYELASERKAIAKMIQTLRARAAEIPAMDEGPHLDERFMDTAQDVFKEWEQDRANFGNVAKSFFSTEALKHTTDFAADVAKGMLTVGAGGAVGTGAAAAGWFGSLLAGGLIGCGAGLVVGLVAHGGVTLHNVRKREEDSPYRFLTILEERGVVFRSEPGVPQRNRDRFVVLR